MAERYREGNTVNWVIWNSPEYDYRSAPIFYCMLEDETHLWIFVYRRDRMDLIVEWTDPLLFLSNNCKELDYSRVFFRVRILRILRILRMTCFDRRNVPGSRKAWPPSGVTYNFTCGRASRMAKDAEIGQTRS